MQAPLSAKAQIRLRDGRRLGYSAFGPVGGIPVLYLHGAIGSPVRRSQELERAIGELGLRYLTVDRPGFGASDPHPGRSVASFADDVEQLAGALGLGSFSVLGVSAGGPYAVACAWRMPDRVTAACVSSIPPGLPPLRATGMSPVSRASLAVLIARPALVTALGDRALETLRRHPGLLARALVAGAPRADRELLRDAHARETAVRSFFAAAERGVAPMVQDYCVCCRPWGFEPEQVAGRVHLWHGARDRLVPVMHLDRLAGALPRALVEVLPGEGHFFLRAHLTRILGRLVDADAAPGLRAAA